MQIVLPATLLLSFAPVAIHAQTYPEYTWTVNAGAITLIKYTGPGGNVDIPGIIAGLPVKTLGIGLFESCTNLTGIMVPDSVTTMGSDVFAFCTSLTYACLGNHLTNISDNAFALCTNLTSVTLGSEVTTIGITAFVGCSSLSNLTLGNRIQSIGFQAFGDCDSLNKVVLPDSITSIGDLAFSDCDSLTNVVLGSALHFLGTFAFSDCPNLAGVLFRGDIPDNNPDDEFGWNDAQVIVYYLPGTSGWGPTFAERPTLLWNPHLTTSDTNLGVQPGGFRIAITGTANIPFVLEAASDIATAPWNPVQSSTLTNGSILFTDGAWTNHSARFYRIRWP